MQSCFLTYSRHKRLTDSWHLTTSQPCRSHQGETQVIGTQVKVTGCLWKIQSTEYAYTTKWKYSEREHWHFTHLWPHQCCAARRSKLQHKSLDSNYGPQLAIPLMADFAILETELTMASRRKYWKRIVVKSTHISFLPPPPPTQSVKGLNWTELSVSLDLFLPLRWLVKSALSTRRNIISKLCDVLLAPEDAPHQRATRCNISSHN